VLIVLKLYAVQRNSDAKSHDSERDPSDHGFAERGLKRRVGLTASKLGLGGSNKRTSHSGTGNGPRERSASKHLLSALKEEEKEKEAEKIRRNEKTTRAKNNALHSGV